MRSPPFLAFCLFICPVHPFFVHRKGLSLLMITKDAFVDVHLALQLLGSHRGYRRVALQRQELRPMRRLLLRHQKQRFSRRAGEFTILGAGDLLVWTTSCCDAREGEKEKGAVVPPRNKPTLTLREAK